jgi:hypothetical protein
VIQLWSGQFPSHVLLSSGVSQVSVLGPILYNLYTTPIHDISVSHGVSDHEYADDDQKYLSFRTSDGVDQRRAFSSMLACIAENRRWGMLNRMKYNYSETELMELNLLLIL